MQASGVNKTGRLQISSQWEDFGPLVSSRYSQRLDTPAVSALSTPCLGDMANPRKTRIA